MVRPDSITQRNLTKPENFHLKLIFFFFLKEKRG